MKRKSLKKKSIIKTRKPLFYWLRLALLFYLPLVIHYLHFWLQKYFSMPSLAQIMNHLMFGIDGLQAANYFYISFFAWVVLLPLGIVVGVGLAFYLTEKILLLLLIKIAGFKLQAIRGLWPGNSPLSFNTVICTLFLIVAGFYTISNSIKLGRALHVTDFANDINALTTTDADYFSQHYIDPKKVTIIPPSEKENLILIYIESLEDSYKNPAFFGRNLLADLNPFEKDGLSLRLNVVGTTTYTAGAHFAVSCGVVSKPVLFNNMSANQQEKMIKTVFQNALCLSDILKANGYYNVFMVSSNDRTGGLGNFYQTHHFDEIYSLSYWQTHGYGYVAHWQNHSYSSTSIPKQGKWGIYDKYILEEGYKKLAALQEKRDHDGQPFFLTITTIDIHPPADSSCTANIANDEKKPFDKVVECTAANLAIFLKNSQQNNLFKNSKVLIMGDHLVAGIININMDDWNRVYPDRRPYNLFLDKTKQPARHEMTHYDLFPSLLDYIGFNVVGGRLGMGYSIFHRFDNYPSVENWDKIIPKVMLYSKSYLDLWKKPNKH